MITQLLRFIWKEKVWWIVPSVIVILCLGFLISVSALAPISPFIYALF